MWITALATKGAGSFLWGVCVQLKFSLATCKSEALCTLPTEGKLAVLRVGKLLCGIFSKRQPDILCYLVQWFDTCKHTLVFLSHSGLPFCSTSNKHTTLGALEDQAGKLSVRLQSIMVILITLVVLLYL